MKALDALTSILLIVGGLNWAIVAATGGSDLVTTLFGAAYADPSMLSRVVYALVGLSAVYQIAMLKRFTSTGSRTLATA